MDEFCSSYNYDIRNRKVILTMFSVLIIHKEKSTFLILFTNWGTSTAERS